MPLDRNPNGDSSDTLEIQLPTSSLTLLDSDLETPSNNPSSPDSGHLSEGLPKAETPQEAAAVPKSDEKLSTEPADTQGSGQNAVVESRIQELLGQMTIAERVGQLVLQPGEDAPGMVRPLDLEQRIEAGLIGGVLQVRGVAVTRALQECAMRSRLRVPLMFGLDVIHGYRVHFPVPLAQAASWDLSVPHFYLF